MEKLKRIETPDIDRLTGFLAAAQYSFLKPQYDVTLEAVAFEVIDSTVTDEDVLRSAYPDFNPIEHSSECSLDEAVAGIHQTLSLPRQMWNPEYSGIPNIIENNLREGYWNHVRACFDYTSARIVELGWDVPSMNIGGRGFTYILYAADMRRCMLLVGNISD